MALSASQRVLASASDLRHANLGAARWVVGFLTPTYGPGGRAKLVQHGDAWGWWRSGASALREIPTAEPGLAPYRDLAARVQRHAGDQATGATLLAAQLVARGLDGIVDGVPAAAYLDGFRLAQRQCRAVLASLRVAKPEEDVLASFVPGGRAWSQPILAGLRGAARDGVADLDRIDIRVEHGAEVAWAAGLRLEGDGELRTGRVGVLLLSTSWTVKPKGDASFVRRGGFDAGHEEEKLRRHVLEKVAALGAGVVVVQGALDEALRDALVARGVRVWTNAPRSSALRLEAATGARSVPRPDAAEKADIGRAVVERREHAWWIRGDGPTWTLVVPAQSGAREAAARDEAERLLRAAGLHLRDPGALPGGGAWQREVAASLRRSADAAPGKSPLGVRAAADAFDALADAVVRNAGLDPWKIRSLDGAWDASACVRVAVDAAFGTAQSVLRLDARYDKRPSSTRGLRGSGRRPGSPKRMPGDVPPLM